MPQLFGKKSTVDKLSICVDNARVARAVNTVVVISLITVASAARCTKLNVSIDIVFISILNAANLPRE